jgi:hypothetical protein
MRLGGVGVNNEGGFLCAETAAARTIKWLLTEGDEVTK